MLSLTQLNPIHHPRLRPLVDNLQYIMDAARQFCGFNCPNVQFANLSFPCDDALRYTTVYQGDAQTIRFFDNQISIHSEDGFVDLIKQDDEWVIQTSLDEFNLTRVLTTLPSEPLLTAYQDFV